MVGPGRPIDTERYFVICPNVIGACMGTTGPASTNPKTGKPWGLDFPVITIRDMVRAQAMLLDHLGIETLFSVAGGSMGGMQVLQWAASYPERVFSALPIAAATRHSAQNIAFHEVGRQAIMADPEWRKGRYFAEGTNPRSGLAVARMGAHITYLSDAALHRKFGRRFQDRDNPTFSFDADFQVESYLRHQGISFVERFDANSYLYLTRAMDYFDLAADYDGVLANACKDTPTRFCVISFTSDWLFPTVGIRAPSCMRSMPAARGSRSPRSSPTRATTPSCSTSRSCSPSCAASSKAPPRRAGFRRRSDDDAVTRLKRDLTMAEAARTPGGARVDLLVVADMVEHGAKVLDVGCGDGELLRLLAETRNVDGRGIELSREGVNEGVAKGLAVIQGDADTDLSDYPNDAFDYVILSQTLQATRQPRVVLEHMLRIGRHAIVSFPNFGHWRIRLQILLRRPHAAHRQPALCLVGVAQHPLLHHQGLPPALRSGRRQDGEGRWRSMPGARRCGSRCRGGSGICSASRRCSCSAGATALSSRAFATRASSCKRPAIKGPQDGFAAWGPSGLRRRATGDIGGMGIARHAWTYRYGPLPRDSMGG